MNTPSNLPKVDSSYIVNNLTLVQKARKKTLYLIMEVALGEDGELPTVTERVSKNNPKIMNANYPNLYVLQPIDIKTKKPFGNSWTLLGDSETLERLGYIKYNDNMFYIQYLPTNVLLLNEYAQVTINETGETILANKGDYIIIQDSEHYLVFNEKEFNHLYDLEKK